MNIYRIQIVKNDQAIKPCCLKFPLEALTSEVWKMASQVQKSAYALLYHELKLRSKWERELRAEFGTKLPNKIAIHKWCKLSKEGDLLRKGEIPVNGQWLRKTM